MRSVFGWDLPPGVTQRMIDEAAGVDAPCAVCWRMDDDCICPTCPECGSVGDPACYEKHGMAESAFQIASRQQAEQREREEESRWDAYAAECARCPDDRHRNDGRGFCIDCGCAI